MNSNNKLVDDNDELIDDVDRNDFVIGKMLRSEKGTSSNYRVVNAFVVNNSKKVFVPTRISSKKSFPGVYDFSVGGYVKSGESYIEALYRETKEEINIEIGTNKCKEILYLNPYSSDISSFMKVYVITWNNHIDYNKNDFSRCTWVSYGELSEMLTGKSNAKPDLLKVINIMKMRNLTIG